MGHATPVIATLAGSKQYLIFTGLNLLGLSASDGHKLWSFPWKTQEDFNTANPVVVGPDQVLISSTDNGAVLIQLGPQNQVIEVWRNRRLRNYFGTPLVRAGLIFAKDDSQFLVCLNVADGREQWRQPKFGTRWCDSGGLMMGDKILITNGRTGDLFVVEATGSRYHQLAWLPSPAGTESLPAPVLADGILLLRSKKQLVALQLSCSRRADLAANSND
jgi:outer membrane protein assembly factor BamB